MTGAKILQRVRWQAPPLREVVEEIFVGIQTSRQAQHDGGGVEVPILSVGDIGDGGFLCPDRATRLRFKAGSFARFTVQPDDILLSCRGTVLKVAHVPEGIEGHVASSSLIVIRCGKRVSPVLLLGILRSEPWQSLLRLRTRSSTGLMQLTIKDIADLPVPLPPEDLQREFVDLLVQHEIYQKNALEAADRRRRLVEQLLERSLLRAG